MSQKQAMYSQENVLNNQISESGVFMQEQSITVKKRDQSVEFFDLIKIHNVLNRACKGFENLVSKQKIVQELAKNIYNAVATEEIEKALILSTIPFIEQEPAYSFVAARLLLQKIYKEAIGFSTREENFIVAYRETFIRNIHKGIELHQLDPRLAEFDLEELAQHLDYKRDRLFRYLGIQTLYEKYFLKSGEIRYELPQAFWMRIAMGLALNEEDKTKHAIEFYNQFSDLSFVSSTPTLLHSGLMRPQLSSCFLATVDDDLHLIFKNYSDSAKLSKWSGGVANDWSNIRAIGSNIKTINVPSQGVVPFLKIANDTTAAISRSGKRRGATVAYLETWHYEIEDFLDLRRNTGDERRRAHDMNTANWIPDLFMKRIMNDELWTLFSPDEVPELHHLYGKAFEEKYEEYERLAKQGKVELWRQIPAQQLWKKMLSRLFETGHPWLTFKDACNIRSPQGHVGVVHSSNLCTEITLNTSKDETAVCNLGSVNLAEHITSDGKLDHDKLAKTIETAMRMLDNVIDINYYPIPEARNSNLKHRPVGLGLMGLQDALFKMDIAFDSEEALTFSDEMMEFVSYHAILSSSRLAKERGAYESFKGSKWDRNVFPLDTIKLLEEERGVKINVNRTEKMDWAPVREHVKQWGMRNSNCMAIAPTATISNIAGCLPCIEPIYKNMYVKANMSGEFTIINHYLVEDLKALNLWNQDMVDKIKYYDGSVQHIDVIPQHIKDKYKEAFEIDPEWLVKITAVRGKWIDQSQSHNVFMKGVSGKKLNDIYLTAWKAGLKTTYYLRTLGASQIEKSTLDSKKFGFTQKRQYETDVVVEETSAMACSIENENCDACQ
jgi:ribonucleoside-diphosphate reductase alpha chain